MKGEPEYVVLTLTRKEADIVREAVEQHVYTLARIHPWFSLNTPTKMLILRQVIGAIDSAIKGK